MKQKYLHTIFATCLSLATFNTMAYNVTFESASRKVITVTPDKSTGLDAIYVAYNVAEISSVKVTGFSSTSPVVSQYSNLGGGYAIEVNSTYDNGELTFAAPDSDMGYVVTDGEKNYYFWLVNYASHKYDVYSIAEYDTQDCDNTILTVTGDASAIKYYTIDGRQKELGREIKLEYTTLEWNEESKSFVSTEATKSVESISGNITINPPFYCDTDVTIKGDRFLKEWGMEESATSGVIKANGIAVMTDAEEEETIIGDDDDASNMITTETTGLGGSAPANITFYGYITDSVLHTEWQIASDLDFENILYRYNEQDLQYTFNEEGEYYVRFIGSNSDGSCEAYGDTYTVSIGASDLRIPNAFSPDGDGVNDVWKVGYRSLLEFRCWIFDKKGTQLFYFDQPDQGWDGKYKGKLVNPGVYFYVIEAKGADGKKYKKGGDINILRYKKLGSSTGSTVTE